MLPEFYFEHYCRIDPGMKAGDIEARLRDQIHLNKIESIVRLKLETHLFIFAKNHHQWSQMQELASRIMRKLDWVYLSTP